MAKNSMYLYGKNSVRERLRVASKSIRQIFIQDNFKSPPITDMIRSENIPYKTISEKELKKIKRADRLQGIIAETDLYTYTPFEDLLHSRRGRSLSLIFLDGLNDPHNLGSIIRITACFGDFAIILPAHGSVDVNETVIHVASGGENYTPVARVTNLSTALLKAKKAGYWAVGTSVEGGEDFNRVSLPFPVCLVLGAEGKGVRYGIQKHLDMNITLPMEGARLSLNVAMACAIFCHEIARQRERVEHK